MIPSNTIEIKKFGNEIISVLSSLYLKGENKHISAAITVVFEAVKMKSKSRVIDKDRLKDLANSVLLEVD